MHIEHIGFIGVKVPPRPIPPKKEGVPSYHTLSKAFIIKWQFEGGGVKIVVWATVITGVPP